MPDTNLPSSAIAAVAGVATGVRRGYVLGCVAAVIWGGYLVTSRRGIAAGLSPADMAFLRYVIAGVVMLPFLLRHESRRLAGVGWKKGLILACLAGPPFVLVGASGFHFAPLAHAAVIQLGAVILVGMLLAAILLRERLGPAGLLSLSLVLLGLFVTAGSGFAGGRPGAWRGDLLFALAGTLWAVFTVLQRRWGLSPVAVTAAVCVISAVVYGPLYAVMVGFDALLRAGTAVLVEQALVQGVLSGAIAMLAFAAAVRELGAARAALFPALAPGVAMLLGVLLTGDRVSALHVIGLALLTGGLLVSAWDATCRSATLPVIPKKKMP